MASVHQHRPYADATVTSPFCETERRLKMYNLSAIMCFFSPPLLAVKPVQRRCSHNLSEVITMLDLHCYPRPHLVSRWKTASRSALNVHARVCAHLKCLRARLNAL